MNQPINEVPQWARDCAEFDGIDTLAIFVGLPACYIVGEATGIGGLPCIMFGAMGIVIQTVLRKSPIIPEIRNAKIRPVEALAVERPLPALPVTTNQLPKFERARVVIFKAGNQPIRPLASYFANHPDVITCNEHETQSILGDYFIRPDGPGLAMVYRGQPMLDKVVGRFAVPTLPAEYRSLRPTGHAPMPMPRHMPETPYAPAYPMPQAPSIMPPPGGLFDLRYTPENPEALELAKFLAQNGYGIKKISELFPFAHDPGREIARDALRAVSKGKRPEPNSGDEFDFVRSLYRGYGVPAQRIARLLDGNETANLNRIATYRLNEV